MSNLYVEYVEKVNLMFGHHADIREAALLHLDIKYNKDTHNLEFRTLGKLVKEVKAE